MSAFVLDNTWIQGCLVSGCSIFLRLLGDPLRLLVDPYILLLPILLRVDSLLYFLLHLITIGQRLRPFVRVISLAKNPISSIIIFHLNFIAAFFLPGVLVLGRRTLTFLVVVPLLELPLPLASQLCLH